MEATETDASSIGLLSAEKQGEIEEILNNLESEIDSNEHPDCEEWLRRLLFHTRSSADGDLSPLFTRRGIRVLGRYAFESGASNKHPAALRCLNNILVRAVPTRQLFVDEGYPGKVVELMKAGDPEDELPTASLLLYCSAETKIDLTSDFEHGSLASTINQNISRHARAGPPPSDPASSCVASLKLLSTLSARYEAEAHRFLPSLYPILDMLDEAPIASPPLQAPISLLIACIASLPVHKVQSFPELAVEKLTDILRLAIPAYAQPGWERELMPLLLVLLRVAQSESHIAHSRLREYLLPTTQDRTVPLGQGDSLPHILLRLGATSMEPELRELVLSLFFELSNNDSSRFVSNVGFGNAAGFLASRGIQVSQDDLAEGEGTGGEPDFNPITGQLRDLEPQPNLPEMTTEEKEREAERLFVLFERLRATGVVNVENPVARTADSSRFEELPDDESEGR